MARKQFRSLPHFLPRPFTSSTPMLSNPTVGPFQIEQHLRHRAAHNGQRSKMARVAADGRAGRPSTTDSPRTVGHTGRDSRDGRCPAIIRRLSRRHRQSAHRYCRQRPANIGPRLSSRRSIASHMDDDLRPRRNAWLGFSSMLMAISAWKTWENRLERRAVPPVVFSIKGAIAEQQKFDVRYAASAQAPRPERQPIAPKSPPMASSAIRTFCGISVPGNLIVAALRTMAAV